MARALHPTSKPSPPAHSAYAYMPQPPSTPPEPPADSPRFHEHHARLDAHLLTLDPDYLSSPLARPSPLGRKDAGASFRLRLRGRRQCPGCRMGTSHVPFAMPAGRVVHPFAPDEGEQLPPVTLPRSLRYRPHSASDAPAWRGHSIPQPSHRPRLSPPPPTCRNRPPLLPSHQRTPTVSMSITPGSMLRSLPCAQRKGAYRARKTGEPNPQKNAPAYSAKIGRQGRNGHVGRAGDRLTEKGEKFPFYPF